MDEHANSILRITRGNQSDEMKVVEVDTYAQYMNKVNEEFPSADYAKGYRKGLKEGRVIKLHAYVESYNEGVKAGRKEQNK